MANETTISPTSEKEDVPYWMILIWCTAGFLAVVMVIVAIYYSYVICCQKKRNKHQRPYSRHQYPRHPMEDYPKALIEHLHNGNISSRAMFSQSFVDHMRIPRAMEVKMIESVNSLNASHPQPIHSPACHSPTRSINDFLNAELFSLPDERIPPFAHQQRQPPSRQQSFRYSANMSVEESKERIYKEKMLVSELREKLRSQRKIDE